MEFFNQAIDILKILVMALGAGLAVWGVINLLEGYGNDNSGAAPCREEQKKHCGNVHNWLWNPSHSLYHSKQ